MLGSEKLDINGLRDALPHEVNPPGLAPEIGKKAALTAVLDLAERLGIPQEGIRIADLRPTVWPDTSLGYPKENGIYAQVRVPGFIITLSAQDDTHRYHADAKGQLVYIAPQAPITTDGPSVTLASEQRHLVAGESAAVYFKLSEQSNDFDVNDIVVIGGYLEGFKGSGTEYQARFVADHSTGGADGLPEQTLTPSVHLGEVRVPSGVFSTIQGVLNADGADLDNAVRFTVVTHPAESMAKAPAGHVYHWKNHALLRDVAIRVHALDADGDDAQPLIETLDISTREGRFELNDLPSGRHALTAELLLDDTDSGTAVSAADALAALKLSVGRNPNPDPDGDGPLEAAPISPYQFLAADVNGDGRVTAADALGILKMSVKRHDAPAREWLFVDEAYGFADASHAGLDHARAVSRQSVPKVADLAPQLDATTLRPINLVALLKGDVTGNWSPEPDASTLPSGYFDELATTRLLMVSTELTIL